MKNKSSGPQVIKRVASLATRLGGWHLPEYGCHASNNQNPLGGVERLKKQKAPQFAGLERKL
jgi:hypothetical protein